MEFLPFFLGAEGLCGGQGLRPGCGAGFGGSSGRGGCRAQARCGPSARPSGPRGPFPFGGRGDAPRSDVKENEEHFVFEVDTPGLRFEDISVTVEDGELVISTNAPEAVGGYSYLVQERRPQTWSRRFPLPEAVDPAAIYASLNHGVLQVTLPKKARSQPIRIPVKAAEDEEAAGPSGLRQEAASAEQRDGAVEEVLDEEAARKASIKQGKAPAGGRKEGEGPVLEDAEPPQQGKGEGEAWDMMDQ